MLGRKCWGAFSATTEIIHRFGVFVKLCVCVFLWCRKCMHIICSENYLLCHPYMTEQLQRWLIQDGLAWHCLKWPSVESLFCPCFSFPLLCNSLDSGLVLSPGASLRHCNWRNIYSRQWSLDSRAGTLACFQEEHLSFPSMKSLASGSGPSWQVCVRPTWLMSPGLHGCFEFFLRVLIQDRSVSPPLSGTSRD